MSLHWMQTVDLCRYYQRGTHEVRAVDRVTVGFERADFTAVVGASGSGKSTLLNLLAGLDTPTSGHIAVGGVRLSSLTRRELAAYRAKRVGMVFQSFNLVSHYTALENVALALYFNDTSPRERQIRASAILERLALADRMGHRPHDLSGGEQQRVAIARALVKKPDVIFADEPTGNLDQENAEQILGLLSELNRDGLTIIMVTHNIDVARRYPRRVVRMDYGAVVADTSGNSPDGGVA
ncbi:MAG TPA: ABC transporter ATP-binding protein [Acidobacteriota bacterium]|nr:ABC transporter ATP-binding protein [Acidobacteriota bacterium]